MTCEVKMPRLGVNDDYVTLASWLVENGSGVTAGQAIASIETSKETSEVVADTDGIISFLKDAGVDVKVDDIIATIGETFENKQDVVNHATDMRMTEKAKLLVKKHNIDVSLLPKNKLIKEKDVLPLISPRFTISKTKNNEIVLYGGGGFSEIAIDILKVTHAYNVHGIVDIKYPEMREVMNVAVLGGDDVLGKLYKDGYRKIFNGIGSNGGKYWRRPPFEKLKPYGFEFPNIIHERAILEPTVSMGEGNLICAGAIVGAGVKIGSNCVVNAGAIISHDTIISDHCHVASGAVLAGVVTVGENTLIGQNVTIYSRVRIGSNVIIENGCSVFKDVPDNTVVRYR